MCANNDSLNIEALTPKDNLDPKADQKFGAYYKSLDSAFRNSKIHNLALSGSLGSGKSSIIRSFDQNRNAKTKRHFLYVSLMDFAKNEHNSEDSQSIQKKLEHNLLNQILSYCTSDDLPEGSIRGIPEEVRHLKGKAIGAAVVSFLIFMLMFPKRFGDLAAKIAAKFEIFQFMDASCRAFIHLMLYVVVGLTLAFCVYCITHRCLPFLQLSKLTFKSKIADAEVLLGKERTTLDTYQFELAYILERIGENYDYTVVFEDLERLDPNIAIDIMRKLRELNTLTNNHLLAKYLHTHFDCSVPCSEPSNNPTTPTSTSETPDKADDNKHEDKSGKETPSSASVQTGIQDGNGSNENVTAQNATPPYVRFVYAISDSTMPVEYRTKFYDCIIPVVPVSNPLNGIDDFSKILNDFDIKTKFPSELSFKLSNAILDYRTRLTLRNEYSVFCELSKLPQKANANTQENTPTAESEIILEKKAALFAITIYKILLPMQLENALAPDGDGILCKFQSQWDPKLVKCYPDAAQRQKAFKAIKGLYDAGLLNEGCMYVLVGDELLKHWMNIIQIILLKEKLVDEECIRAAKVIDALAQAFETKTDKSIDKDIQAFRNAMSNKLYTLLSKEQEQHFILVANSLAAVSRKDVAGDWEWLTLQVPSANDAEEAKLAHKWSFTHMIRFLSIYQKQSPKDFESIKMLLMNHLNTFCAESTKQMQTTDMINDLYWDDDMGRILSDLLSSDALSHLGNRQITYVNGTAKKLSDYKTIRCTA